MLHEQCSPNDGGSRESFSHGFSIDRLDQRSGQLDGYDVFLDFLFCSSLIRHGLSLILLNTHVNTNEYFFIVERKSLKY